MKYPPGGDQGPMPPPDAGEYMGRDAGGDEGPQPEGTRDQCHHQMLGNTWVEMLGETRGHNLMMVGTKSHRHIQEKMRDHHHMLRETRGQHLMLVGTKICPQKIMNDYK